MTVLSKRIVDAFYGRAAKRAYFTRCSTGGEQALMEAQNYPAAYASLTIRDLFPGEAVVSPGGKRKQEDRRQLGVCLAR